MFSAAGFAIGLGAGAFSFTGLWAISQLMGQAMMSRESRRFGPIFLLVLVGLKLAALAIGWQWASAIGRPGQVGFGSGIVLVYCLAVAGIVLRTNPERPSGT